MPDAQEAPIAAHLPAVFNFDFELLTCFECFLSGLLVALPMFIMVFDEDFTVQR